MKIDDFVINILRYLQNGRISFAKIAENLSVVENTVRSRIKTLMDEDALDIVGRVNPEALPGHMLVIFGVNTVNTDLVKTAEEFSRLKGVVSVSVVTGRYDLMVTALLNSEYGLVEFVTKEVPKIKEVSSTEAFVAYKSYGVKVPYIL
jgi:Lrp/AsnC family transcriptional regulator for asnA, asnC and gidA